MNEISDWTILIYANGNNELEPETYQMLLDVSKCENNENVNLLIEIGREDRHSIRIIRPEESIADSEDIWCGVRRYIIRDKAANLLEDLGNRNMADPMQLYNFIEWGMEVYPARHYMLILGGHGASYIGVMSDYSQNVPYIMGTPEMCKSIQMAGIKLNKKIDILVLDMCYMNYIEVLYELGKESGSTVQNILTYIEEGPFEGLPYKQLIQIIQNNTEVENSEELLRIIVSSITLNLIAIKMEYFKLEKIKNLYNNAALSFLKNGKKRIEAEELVADIKDTKAWNKYMRKINRILSGMIICYRIDENGKEEQHNTELPSRLINIITMDLGDFLPVYYKLSFSRNNYWTHFIAGESLSKYNDTYINIKFEPTALTKEGVLMLILSSTPGISLSKSKKILNDFYTYKNWLK